MEPPPFESKIEPGDVEFRIKYEKGLGGASHPRLKGRGWLTVRARGAEFVFSGTKKGWFKREKATETLHLDEISNVWIDHDCVRFSAGPDDREIGLRSFVFYCESPDEAAALTAYLPFVPDATYTERQAFFEQVESLGEVANPKRSLTFGLVALNIAVFVVVGIVYRPGWFNVTNMEPYHLFGANNGAATTDGEWWRLITSMFMHYGVIHVAINMWSLTSIGLLYEKLQGRALFLLTYLASGIGGGLMSMEVHGDKVWSAGASGAIFGMIGAFVGFALRERKSMPKSVSSPLLRSALTLTAYNLLYGQLNTQIDNACHVGGLVTGLLFGWLCAVPLNHPERKRWQKTRLLQGSQALALLVAVGVWHAPRFPYSARERFALDAVIREFDANGSVTGAELMKRMKAWGDENVPSPEVADYVSNLLIPSYRGFAGKLEALKLAPEKETHRDRDMLKRYISLKADGYEHLVRAARAGSHAELAASVEKAKEADALLKEYQRLSR